MSGSPSAEIASGNAAAVRNRLVAESGGLYTNAARSQQLAMIGDRLSKASGGMHVTVLVLNSAVANAYFAPGGYIYLTRKLLTLTGDDSEIAAVVAHEMAHILSGDAEARVQFGVDAAVSSADIREAIGNSDAVRALLAKSSARVSAFSQQQELQADALAIRLLAKAGYDPAALARFLATMQAHERAGLRGETFTAAHPAPSVRIARARKLAQSSTPYQAAAGAE
ncbi:M48 family metalloprotease [Martelella lutilitoris]|nr:M48 family metalloprotease [Martelella lutilitoris]